MGFFSFANDLRNARYNRAAMKSQLRMEQDLRDHHGVAVLEVVAGRAKTETVRLERGGREVITLTITDNKTGEAIHRVDIRLHLKDIR